MNLPNKLTLARIIMIPVFTALFYLEIIPYNFAVAAAVFAIAAFTDFLDGYIARKYDLVTDLGKFLDPIADKLCAHFGVSPDITTAALRVTGIQAATVAEAEKIIKEFANKEVK